MTSRLLRSLLWAAAVLLAVPSAEAQSSPAPIKYGKWLLLGGSLGLNLAAAGAHEDADRAFDTLRARCAVDQSLCTIAGGMYLDPGSEALYQETLRHDRRSRKLLIGGEAALLGAAALFVWEFARPRGRPENIPFEPAVSYRNGVTRLGVQMAW
ncbi:MAG TPA: hypothetical protein VFT04_05310 [Gemmatimonadales bacterium]|nr:hypothetical protein [Gemmatimonadales bacterium]